MPRRIKHSFTLVEMVVAMAIMMMVAMIVGTAGKLFYDGYRTAQRATARLKEYMAIDRLWDGAVRNAVPFKWTDEDNVSRFVFEGKNVNAELSARNIPDTKTALVNTINVFDILKCDSLVVTKAAAEKIQEVYV